MKRLGVFCLYDPNGRVWPYVEHLLDDLVNNVTTLIIVVNGSITNSGLNCLHKYTTEVHVRENKGYDFSAFRYALLSIVGKTRLNKYDELLWCNDTFFGPFVPIDEIIKKMNDSCTDWWGITKREGPGCTYIDSFFLAFRKRVIDNNVLVDYLEQTDYAIDGPGEAYAAFEYNLYKFLSRNGYKDSVYSNTKNNNYYQYPYYCMLEYGLPILKKKCFSIKYQAGNNDNRRELVKAIKLIKQKYEYDISELLDSANAMYGCSLMLDERKYPIVPRKTYLPFDVNPEELALFFSRFNNIYCYGTGITMKEFWYVYPEYNDRIVGFIVSDAVQIETPTCFGRPVVHYNQVEEGTAIIVALNRDNAHCVKLLIRSNDPVIFLRK